MVMNRMKSLFNKRKSSRNIIGKHEGIPDLMANSSASSDLSLEPPPSPDRPVEESKVDSNSDCGYGYDDYGYDNEATPDVQARANASSTININTGRRTTRTRRVSIGSNCSIDSIDSSGSQRHQITTNAPTYAPPCHRSTMPRRSSLKSSTPDGGNGLPSGSQHQQHRGEIEVELPGKTKRKVKRRVSIGYADEVQVNEVAPAAQLTKDPEKLWFKDDEYNLFRQKNLKIVKLVQMGSEVSYCTRGLERYLHSKDYQERAASAWYSVLLEQEMQRKQGTFSEEEIRNLYQQECSRQSQEQAARRAAEDAADAQRYSADVREQISNLRSRPGGRRMSM